MAKKSTEDLEALFGSGRIEAKPPASPKLEPKQPARRQPTTKAPPVTGTPAPRKVVTEKLAGGGVAPTFRRAEPTYPHRLSLDLSTVRFRQLKALAFENDLRHVTLARHLLALAMDTPAQVAQAAVLAHADLEASKAARAKR
jgi:hypothetical protein